MSGIGWYVHHHGRGHLTRFLAVRPHLDAPVVVFSSLEAPVDLPPRTSWIVLPRDDEPFSAGGATRDPRDADPTVGGLLHWAPLGHPGHRRRLALIAAASAEQALDAFVVDVSVEVTLWVRLLGLPAVVFTQPGDRTDEPHALAYRAADRIIAPWPRGLVSSGALETAGDRVTWVGGISRFAGRERAGTPVPGTALILGNVGPADAVADTLAAASDSGWTIVSAGADAAGWREDPWELLCASEVVVSAAGQNSVADIATAGARAVVIPQERPFAEQVRTADALDSNGLAVVVSSWPQDLVPLLKRARGVEPDWRSWQTEDAPARAAEAIARVLR